VHVQLRNHAEVTGEAFHRYKGYAVYIRL